jgi:hypothetical protein
VASRQPREQSPHVGMVVPAPSSKVGRRAEAVVGSNGATVEQGKERRVTIDGGVGYRARAARRLTKQEQAGSPLMYGA